MGQQDPSPSVEAAVGRFVFIFASITGRSLFSRGTMEFTANEVFSASNLVAYRLFVSADPRDPSSNIEEMLGT
jgi:hypothetical protein